MRVLRSMVIAAVVAALLATTLATAAVGAGKGKLTFVQGNPSTRVDLCVNGKEMASKMPFGKAVYRKLAPGPKMVKFRKASPGVCKGKLLAQKKMVVSSSTDRTIVLSKKKPRRVMSFDNSPLPAPPPPLISPWVDGHFRHAADMGEMRFFFESRNLPSTVAAITPWAKGTSRGRTIDIFPPSVGSYQWSTTWVARNTVMNEFVAGPSFVPIREGDRYEWILIGTEKRHKLKFIRRDL